MVVSYIVFQTKSQVVVGDVHIDKENLMFIHVHVTGKTIGE